MNIQNYTIKFEIWDTSGQERYHALTPMYYSNATTVIVVFDVSNASSFDRAKKCIKYIIKDG